MKQELKTLKSDELLQLRWKMYIHYACREQQMRSFRELMEKVRKAFENLKDYLIEFKNELCGFFKDTTYYVFSNLSTNYPHIVDKISKKVNTRGYPRPINRCARSRCK